MDDREPTGKKKPRLTFEEFNKTLNRTDKYEIHCSLCREPLIIESMSMNNNMVDYATRTVFVVKPCACNQDNK